MIGCDNKIYPFVDGCCDCKANVMVLASLNTLSEKLMALTKDYYVTRDELAKYKFTDFVVDIK